MRKFIVIPEGVRAGPDGLGVDEPSFVYRQVLDFTLRLAGAGDEVYLAPANAFGGPLREEEAAQRYLARRQAAFRVLYPGFNLPANPVRPRYVDTLDNARLLREVLGTTDGRYDLICAQKHARRAEWCFRRVGFGFVAVHRVPHVVEAEAVPARLFYYRHPLLYQLYEFAAWQRDVVASALGIRPRS